jgi:hypothetical protein
LSRFNAVDGLGAPVSDDEVLKRVKVYAVFIVESARALMKMNAPHDADFDEIDAALADLRNSEPGEWATDTWRKLSIAIDANSGMIDALETLAREHAAKKREVRH